MTTRQHRSNPSGVLLVKVRNKTRNKIRLPKGFYFGLLRLVEEESNEEDDISIINTISNNKSVVDLLRIKIEPSDDTSDESVLNDRIICDNSDSTSSILDSDILIASDASEYLDRVDILKELSEQLTAEAPGGDLISEWEELNPTFASISINSNIGDVDMELVVDQSLPIFEDLAGVTVGSETEDLAIAKNGNL